MTSTSNIKIIISSLAVLFAWVLSAPTGVLAYTTIDPDWVDPAYISAYTDNDPNTVGGYDSVKVTGVFDAGSTTDILDTGSNYSSEYNATGLAAFLLGNDQDDNIPKPSLNIGHVWDGLLNGDEQLFEVYDEPLMPVNKNDTFEGYYEFDGMEFISASDLYDIPGNESTEDTGWINLGRQESENQSFDYESVTSPFDGSTLSIDELVTIGFEFTVNNEGEKTAATWSITPEDDILEKAAPYIGTNYFDHLAFVLKASDYFAIYDLDFNKIFAAEFYNTSIDTSTLFRPVILEGTIDNFDFGKGISHISVWAHDPAGSLAVIPEPSTFILLGAGLIGLGFYARRRKT